MCVCVYVYQPIEKICIETNSRILELWGGRLAVKKLTLTKVLGLKMKINASSIIFVLMVKATGVLSLNLQDCLGVERVAD